MSATKNPVLSGKGAEIVKPGSPVVAWLGQQQLARRIGSSEPRAGGGHITRTG